MKKCPHCQEQIQEAATKCRFCGEFLVLETPLDEAGKLEEFRERVRLFQQHASQGNRKAALLEARCLEAFVEAQGLQGRPEVTRQLEAVAAHVKALEEARRTTGRTSTAMGTVNTVTGALLILAGILLFVVFAVADTTVEVPGLEGVRVHNLWLVRERNTGVAFGLGSLVVGALLVGLAGGPRRGA